MDNDFWESERQNRKLRFTSVAANTQIKMDGEWEKSLKVFKNLDKDIRLAYIAAQISAATRLRSAILKRIKDQDFRPLSPKYKAQKIADGKRPEIWRRTDKIKKNIKIIRRGLRISVGIPAKAKYENGKKLTDIASMLEFGNGGKLPARPLFGPAKASLNNKTMALIMARHLKKHIIDRYQIKPKFRTNF